MRLRIVAVLLVWLSLASAEIYADDSFAKKLSDAAIERTQHRVIYDPTYFVIPYPNGDVPQDKGVCTDEIIRIFRKLGIDLQQHVHNDMKNNFGQYPKLWGLTKTDTNIDHRRVPNLQVFFERHGQVLPVTNNAEDYVPGDIVTWNLKTSGTLPHIGIITEKKSKDGKRYMVVHNIGNGPQLEDMLFDYTITGHYRYWEDDKR